MAKQELTRKDLILRTSLRLFVESDLQASSMSEIAKAAGIPVGSIYTYFAGKDALIAEVYLDGRRRLRAAISEQLRGKTSARETLMTVWTFLCSYHIENKDDFIFAERFQASPYFTDDIRAQNETLWADLAMIFEQAKRDRIIKDVPLDLFLPMLHGALSALIRNDIHGTRKLTEPDIELAVTTLWAAIACPQS